MKKALVTGGSRGLGLAVCRQLLQSDWQVVTTARKLSAELRRLKDEYPKRLEFHQVDLAERGAVAELSRHARLLEGIDGFVANAGIGTEGLLTLTSEEALRQCIELNLVSTLLLAKEVVKGMLKGGGSLVFVSSVAARTGFSGLSVYSATKGALVSFSRSIAREYGDRGVRCNCVLPGFLETEMTGTLNPEQKERITRRTALKRLGQPEDAAGFITYLLSDNAKYVTGSEYVIDGGLSA
jgi:3-oxoacyl-[acyl-carrier protein] reductase